MELTPVKRLKTHYLSAILFLIFCIGLSAAILHIDATVASKPAVGIVRALIWPFFFIEVLILFRDHWLSMLEILTSKILTATDISIGKVSIKSDISKIPTPAPTEEVKLVNVALMHTSFLRPDKTKKFADGMTYYQIEIIVVATSKTLDRIELVTYHLDPSYKQATQVTSDRNSRFKIKELANGTSIVRASIKFREQDSLVQVNRFIDLRPEGPRI